MNADFFEWLFGVRRLDPAFLDADMLTSTKRRQAAALAIMNAAAIEQLMEDALVEAQGAADAAGIEAVRIKYLGRQGRLPEIMKGLKSLTPEERPLAGQAANQLKQRLTKQLADRKDVLEPVADTASDHFDVTLPGRWRGLGSRHPISQVIEETVGIFRRLGFTVADGPDIDTPFHNFDALNTPADHPSRDAQDTFYLDPEQLLRTQTSTIQIRYMQEHKPPVRILAPGRCFRRDTTDATHSANFHQIEGLYVDKQVSLADLKGDLSYFIHELMGKDTQIRFRPHFFPFTEPSVEVDFSCHLCEGKGCRVCKGSGWIEIAGAGLVDPEVFKAVGYDPEAVKGYAFGMGVERIAMIRYGIADIRMFYENDERFLSQF